MGIVEVLTELGEGLASMFVTVLQTLAQIFFTVGEAGAITITPLGYIALISLVVTIVWRLFNFVRGLITSRVGR